MREWQSQFHVRGYCRYHVVWVPKYRKRAIFGEMRRGVGRIVRELCQRHGVELVEGHALSDHVHVLLGIPPKLSVANTVGFLKGKSAIRIHREYLGRQRNFTGYHLWARGYCVSTVGVAEEVIRDYIRKQTRRHRRNWNLANRRPLRGAFLIPPPQGAVADFPNGSASLRSSSGMYVHR
jgi:putative transposase